MAGKARMTDRVDALVDSVQPTRSQAPQHGIGAQPRGVQLTD
jgi:hypothetical protein